MKQRCTALAVATTMALALGFGATTAHAAGETVNDVASGVTAVELAEQLVGDDTAISNITLTGTDTQIGTYSGFTDLTSGSVDASAGIVLATGIVEAGGATTSAVAGPNKEGGTSTDIHTPGDADLDALLTAAAEPGSIPLVTHDAVSLEFDFVANTDMLQFSYAFGSEEYLEYVGSRYNDIFGLFVNGTNCATTGSAGEAVSINTINPDTNADLYRDNPVGTASASSPINVGFDGMTTVLTCQTAVNEGATNHVKFAIGDVSDGALDSGVFIVAGSFVTEVPAPKDDAATTKAEQPVTVPVLSNDDGTDLTLDVDPSQPQHGDASIQGDQIVYAPEAGYSGPDSFDYTVTGSSGVTATATVTITVTPNAIDDTATTTQGVPTTIDASSNDKGSDVTVTAVGEPAHGEATIKPDGGVDYTPGAGYSGSDEFTYTITDAAEQDATATVTVTVVAPPVAVDDTATTAAATPVTIKVPDNDTGTDLTLAIGQAPGHGTATVSDGAVIYTPEAGFFDVDTFTYVITDSLGATATATVTVTVTAPATPPTVVEVATGGSVTGTPSAPMGMWLLLAAGAAAVIARSVVLIRR